MSKNIFLNRLKDFLNMSKNLFLDRPKGDDDDDDDDNNRPAC